MKDNYSFDMRQGIGIWGLPKDVFAVTMVQAALFRSFSRAQVCRLNDLSDLTQNIRCVVLVNPSNEMFLHIMKCREMKIVLLGTLDSMWAEFIGAKISSVPQTWAFGDSTLYAGDNCYSHSPWQIDYSSHELTQRIPYKNRYLSRFDFTDEWNNHGYGRIWAHKESPFALAADVDCGSDAVELARVEDGQGKKVTSYAIVRENSDFSVLWINRAVGLIDSLEWSIIETFLSDYRSESLCCFPRLLEIPAGVSGICTMRLDCDQAIASARPLFELYQQEKIPFSLAILTGLSLNADDKALIRDVIDSGGGILSHSVNHLPDWGGNYETAFYEASESKQWLINNCSLQKPYYLVSPFHQNSRYAVKAMVDSGYSGFVGGIIHNDPEYLFARSGVVPYHEEDDFFSLSQQCMLHGDCFHQYGNSIAPYIEAFENQMAGEGIFGYLDHPFSSAYQYGWLDEEERLVAHQALIRQMKSHANIRFCNLGETMEFCRKRSQAQVWIDENTELNFHLPNLAVNDNFIIQAVWKNQKYSLR